MRRLFCYTLSARAIGATVSAGALHAQGWGFESLIAHHRFGNGPRKGTVFCLGPFHGIRTRKGAELRKREAFSSAAREGRQARSESGRRQPHADIPHRPPPIWKRSSKGDRFLFGPISWDSNPQGCGAEETRSVFQRSTRGPPGPKRKRAAPAARGHPSSPTTELLGLQ